MLELASLGHVLMLRNFLKEIICVELANVIGGDMEFYIKVLLWLNFLLLLFYFLHTYFLCLKFLFVHFSSEGKNPLL